MACRYTYNGKTYEAHEFDDVLRALPLAEASKFMAGVVNIPPAPFVGKTDAWVALALKRIIKLAVDGGYDRVALVTGQQAADLYDLSKQIDGINYTRRVGPDMKPNGKFDIVARKDHHAVLNEFSVDADRVEALVGKEVAKKIIEAPEPIGRLSGLDLKVGGEGMRAFYDQIVPQVARDVLKKMGGEGLTDVAIAASERRLEVVRQTLGANYLIKDLGSGEYFAGTAGWVEPNNRPATFGSFETANNRAAELQAELDNSSMRQPGFDITPAMVDKAGDGLPLFSTYRNDEALEKWAAAALDGRLLTRRWFQVSKSLPHPAWLMAGLDGRLPVTIDVRLVSHLKSSGHDEVTPAMIGRLADLMAHPRIMIRNEVIDDNGNKVIRHQALLDAKDDQNRPLLVAVRKSAEGDGQKVSVYDVRSMFGRQESMVYVIDQLRHGNVVWMADKEAVALQEFMGSGTMPAAGPKAGARPSSATTRVIVPGDAAAAAYPAKGWAKSGNQITLTKGARERAAGLQFSPARDPQTETEAFKSWFRESKVVDARGNPMRVYHATTAAGFSEFKRGRGDLGIHFGTSRQAEARFDVKVRVRPLMQYLPNLDYATMPVYLSLQNPLRMDDVGRWDSIRWVKPALERLFNPERLMAADVPAGSPWGILMRENGGMSDIRKALQELGYDGVVYRNKNESPSLVEIDKREFAGDPNAEADRAAERERLGREGDDSYIVFDPRQIKSAIGNDGGFDPSKKDITKSTERQTESPEFKQWFGDSKVVDDAGKPLVVYHGTTHDIAAFDGSRANPESDFGAGFYFSNTKGDADANYAGEGPDLTARIERLAEQIANDLDEEKSTEELHEMARAQLSGGAPNVMPVYLSLQNPVVLGGKNRTFLTYEEPFDEEKGDVGEEVGTLVDVLMALQRLERSFNDVDYGEIADAVLDEAREYGGIRASEFVELARKSSGLIYATDDEGNAVSGEVLRQAFEDAGFDGIIDNLANQKFGSEKRIGKAMDGMVRGTSHYIAFKPEQIKSAIGNNGEFDIDEPDITRSAARAWDAPETSAWFDSAVYTLQDKHVDTKRVLSAIKEAGNGIADSLDVYLQEELFHGRAAKRTEDFVHLELEPLIEAMKADGLSIAELDDYLHARHAREANEVIARRNPEIQDGGSGMLNQDAAAYFAELPADKRAALEAAAAKVDAILTGTRSMMVDYQLESGETVQGWSEMFEHYVPLMREDDGVHTGNGTGQGFSIKGRETKSRTGSTRKVVDILANIAMQRERTIVRGEKNRVAQALVGLAQANPNKDFWRVDSVPTTQAFNPATGLVEERPDNLFKQRDNVMVAKVAHPGGIHEHAVIFNEADQRAVRMSTALKNLDAAQLEGMLGASAKLTRYFASVNTQYNPVFGVVNLIRDVQEALVNLGGTELAGKQKAIARNTMSALRGVYGDLRAVRKGHAATSDWAQLWEDFQNAGGQTGFRQLFTTSADRAKAIEQALDPHAWMDSKLGKIFTAGGALKVPMAAAQRGAKWIFDWLSDYNEAMENCVRLAAYRQGLDAGMSRERAASLAKNLTVNFNRKGQAGQQAGALYAFFNASVQGTARIGRTLFDMEPGKPKSIRLSSLGKKVVYGGMLLGSMQALALAAAGFGDDDPPEFARNNNLIIPIGGKKYVTIPMPMGLRLLPAIGRTTTEFALGGFKHPTKRLLSMVGLMADTFNPIGNAGMSMQTLAPTVFDPLVALTENKDFAGRPIARESRNKAIPGYTLARDTSSSVGKVVAEAINYLSGGTQYTAGVVSPTPDQIDYLIGQVTGGVGRELTKVNQTAGAALTGESMPLYKVPLAGRFVGDARSQASESTSFHANTDRLNELETEIKGLRGDGKRDEANRVRLENPEAYLITQANHAEQQIQKLNKQKRELIKNDAPREQVKAIEERITARMAALNRAVEALEAR